MRSQSLITLLFASSTTALFGRPNHDICKAHPYAAMQAYASYAPAQSSCWASYPGKTSTITQTGGHTTTWVTETCTETTTIPGYVSPTSYPGSPTTATTTTPIIPISSSSSTTTTFQPVPTITPTPTANGVASRNKRRAAMADGYKELMESYSSYGDCLSTACSCIMSPKTTTVTSGSITAYTKTTTTTITSTCT